MNILVYIAVSVSIGVGGTRRFTVRARPRTVGRVQTVTVGDIFLVMLGREERFCLASLTVQAELMAETTGRIGWTRRTRIGARV